MSFYLRNSQQRQDPLLLFPSLSLLNLEKSSQKSVTKMSSQPRTIGENDPTNNELVPYETPVDEGDPQQIVMIFDNVKNYHSLKMIEEKYTVWIKAGHTSMSMIDKIVSVSDKLVKLAGKDLKSFSEMAKLLWPRATPYIA